MNRDSSSLLFGWVWFGLVWVGLVWVGLGWFGLVWLVWFGLVLLVDVENYTIVGTHDGEMQHHRYFKTAPKRGCFIKYQYVRRILPAEKNIPNRFSSGSSGSRTPRAMSTKSKSMPFSGSLTPRYTSKGGGGYTPKISKSIVPIPQVYILCVLVCLCVLFW